MSASSVTPKAYIVYDGECPFCKAYVLRLRLNAALGNVQLVNARSQHPIVLSLLSRGYELNEGMALVIGERVYVGAHCAWLLAMLSTRVDLFNKVNALLFSSHTVATLSYPVLRWGRKTALFLLRRPQLLKQRHD
ncbi:Protein of uncharacterised function, DUF393 [Pandoraea pulmonicola]|uniref:Protein of uncharacterized function, DUF393 n=1 Tax=Pandoraea pulmonicola TaxID=93221 RepID=A0AAJ4ZBD9_PANPU|nr:Protein of uncharacterised function, DUF393 [Pandoraea pulmonicola]